MSGRPELVKPKHVVIVVVVSSIVVYDLVGSDACWPCCGPG